MELRSSLSVSSCPTTTFVLMSRCPAVNTACSSIVIRAEDGLLADLENIFRDVFRNYSKLLGSLPQGSIVLLGSTSHLSLLGLSAYTED